MGRPSRRSAPLLRACCGAAVAGLLLQKATWEQATSFASGLVGRRAPTAPLAVRSLGPLEGRSPVARQALDGLEALQGAAAYADAANAAGFLDSSLLTSFSDQAGNINGTLFMASLPSYLLFLYFLSYRGNNTPPLVLFGFTFLLAFVISTIPSGIISKSVYGVILADSDWIHGTAESLLTCTNIMIVLGFRSALTGDKDLSDNSLVKNIAFGWLALVVGTLAAGVPLFGFEVHAPFLSGLGALSPESFSAEPVNALSIPNWMVHWSTVFEFLLSMTLAWRYADASGNPRWKGLTWGMLPSSASSVCALSFHVFYNQIPWILTAQAFFTFLGNTTLGIAAYRIAVSNGWTLAELDPRPTFSKLFSGGEKAAEAETEEPSFDMRKVRTLAEGELTSGPLLAAEIVLLTLVFAYGTKYGELAVGPSVWQSPDSSAAAAAVVSLPILLTAYSIFSQSADLQSGKLPALAFAGALGKEVAPGASSAEVAQEKEAAEKEAAAKEEKSGGLSFQDVKKYGVAGIVAYVVTELAFWAVALPFAAYSLYSTTGHWPDLASSNEDRAAVGGFVFAGANIARLAVPVRL
ncbi:unnamed protein product, partial [Polarella glacialis]